MSTEITRAFFRAYGDKSPTISIVCISESIKAYVPEIYQDHVYVTGSPDIDSIIETIQRIT